MMGLWLLGASFGLVGLSWVIMEFASSLRFSVDYRFVYIRERLNYLMPLYLVGVGAVVLTLITPFPWPKAYLSYVTVLGLTVGGRVFFNRVRKRVVRSLDVYDLDLDLLIVSIAIALLPISLMQLVLTMNLVSTAVLFVEVIIMYVRARKRQFDVGQLSALIYSMPLLAMSLYSLVLSVIDIAIFAVSLFALALFMSDFVYLMMVK